MFVSVKFSTGEMNFGEPELNAFSYSTYDDWSLES